ncbi:hypothetical protein AVEN_108132-1 [Araneus ventricosus]|uniref:Uncharacterized protein n=1 Tax=Araneus ventricosus TaxID=182803 RepID=A0A4Y2ABL4_ARAVE|nr:hypothetical protein AVEN_108132-1 [Araneus ventricosus]
MPYEYCKASCANRVETPFFWYGQLYVHILEWELQAIFMARGGLVARSRLRGQRSPNSKPDSSEDPPCMHVHCMLNHTYDANSPLTGLAWRPGDGV